MLLLRSHLIIGIVRLRFGGSSNLNIKTGDPSVLFGTEDSFFAGLLKSSSSGWDNVELGRLGELIESFINCLILRHYLVVWYVLPGYSPPLSALDHPQVDLRLCLRVRCLAILPSMRLLNYIKELLTPVIFARSIDSLSFWIKVALPWVPIFPELGCVASFRAETPATPVELFLSWLISPYSFAKFTLQSSKS